MKYFDGFDWDGFWVQDDWAIREFALLPPFSEDSDWWERYDAHGIPLNLDGPPNDEIVERVEAVLGYRLPPAYIELAVNRNGGIPARNCYRTRQPTTWAADHVQITRLFSIGVKNNGSLAGNMGSRFWMEEWGYPDIGVYFADTPSGGHDMLCLDYRSCGRRGEPAVVHVDQEAGPFVITPVAPDFATFIRGLETEERFAE